MIVSKCKSLNGKKFLQLTGLHHSIWSHEATAIKWYYSGHPKPKLFSKLFRTKEAIPKQHIESPSSSKSLKLMLHHGFISSSSAGVYSLLPLTVICLKKLCTLIEILMENIGGQEVLLPTLAHSSLWKKSGRWNSQSAELFKFRDRHSVEYCLGPTHEEVITELISCLPFPLKSLPFRLYQISTKFRDELNPKFGLLRGREFLMKDMYTFDATEENARSTYSDVCNAYDKLFQLLDMNCFKVQGSNTGMGGSVSHEYHFLSDIGEDKILRCSRCKTGVNEEVSSESTVICSECKAPYETSNSIEVGHAFILGTTYTEPFNAKFKDKDGASKLLHMGCYGLGVTRILAACIECLVDRENIRWPTLISPFLLSLIPPKRGSKEENAKFFADFLVQSLSTINILSDAIIVDDRTQLTIGRRLQDANAIGIPYVVIAGVTALGSVPKVEVVDVYNNREMFLTHAELMSFFQELDRTISNKWNILK